MHSQEPRLRGARQPAHQRHSGKYGRNHLRNSVSPYLRGSAEKLDIVVSQDAFWWLMYWLINSLVFHVPRWGTTYAVTYAPGERFTAVNKEAVTKRMMGSEVHALVPNPKFASMKKVWGNIDIRRIAFFFWENLTIMLHSTLARPYVAEDGLVREPSSTR